MVDYEYILFCYNVLKSGKSLKVDRDRINESKIILGNKNSSDYTEDDRLAVYRISFIESVSK